MFRRTTAALAALLAVVAVAVALAGCSGDAGDVTDAAARAGTTAPSTTTTTGAEPAPVAVTAVDYAFQGLPDRVPAGTAIRLTNASATEVHELVAVRLDDADERTVDQLVALPDGELQALAADGAATVLVAGPGGGEAEAVEGDGRLDRPGRYLLVCTIPTGADAQAHAVGGPPHFTAGMYGQLVVQ